MAVILSFSLRRISLIAGSLGKGEGLHCRGLLLLPLEKLRHSCLLVLGLEAEGLGEDLEEIPAAFSGIKFLV